MATANEPTIAAPASQRYRTSSPVFTTRMIPKATGSASRRIAAMRTTGRPPPIIFSGLLSESTGGDLIHVAFPAAGARPGAGEHPADLFHRPLRAKVLRSDEKHDAADESEGVLQHQPLHFAVVATAPVGSGQERPADLHFVSLSVVPVKSRGADHPLRDRINGDQCSAGRQCLVKEHPEACDLVAGFVRMLLPDQRVGSDRVQVIMVLRTKRPELDEISLQNRLPIERQVAPVS